MNALAKKIGIFIIVFLMLTVLSRFAIDALPVKMAKVVSESMAPAYSKGDLIFFKPAATYDVSDVVVYRPLTENVPIVVRIIEKNPDGTFKVKGDANKDTIPELDQNSLKVNQIEGKVTGHTNFMLFYLVLNGALFIIAFIVTMLLSAKLKR